MSIMTKTVSSECSSLSDIDYDPITSTFAKLRAVISQEASLRKELDNLFVKRTEEARIAVQNAQNHLEMVKTQGAHMREILKTDSTTANEMHDSASNASPGDTDGREQMGGCEILQGAVIVSMVERRQMDAFEKLGQEQEESDRLAKLEEERIAELEMERRAKEEENRLAVQEAAAIAAIEARRQAEADKRQLEEELWDKEEEDRTQEATIVAAIEARRATKARTLQHERDERVTREETDRARLEDVKRIEQELMEAEMYRLAQVAQKKIDGELEARRLAEIEHRRVDGRRERKGQGKMKKGKGRRERKNEIKRARREMEEDRALLEEEERLEHDRMEAEMYRLAQEEAAELAQLEQWRLMEDTAEAEGQLEQLMAELEEARLLAYYWLHRSGQCYFHHPP